MVAVNPALVRSVETQTSGGCKIIFDHDHELMVDASFYEIIKALWGSSPMSEIKEMTALPTSAHAAAKPSPAAKTWG